MTSHILVGRTATGLGLPGMPFPSSKMSAVIFKLMNAVTCVPNNSSLNYIQIQKQRKIFYIKPKRQVLVFVDCFISGMQKPWKWIRCFEYQHLVITAFSFLLQLLICPESAKTFRTTSRCTSCNNVSSPLPFSSIRKDSP